MSELNVKELTVTYGDVIALDAVNLSLDAGQIVGVVGESGSGKSTLARAIVGLTPIHSGSLTLSGVLIPNRAGPRRTRAMLRTQMIFQDPKRALDPRFTIEQCVAEALPRNRFGQAPRDQRQKVSQLLEMVALDPDLRGSKPGDLSGGQQQRVAIARALAAEPQIIIADEVTASLDVSVQAVILNLLRSIQQETGMAMIFISHNLAVVRYMADRIAVMYRGRIVEEGLTQDVIGHPKHEYTQQLLESVPRPGERLEANRQHIEDPPAYASP